MAALMHGTVLTGPCWQEVQTIDMDSVAMVCHLQRHIHSQKIVPKDNSKQWVMEGSGACVIPKIISNPRRVGVMFFLSSTKDFEILIRDIVL